MRKSLDKATVTQQIVFPVEFYDVDSMRIVWHGNYVQYMEKARCALLDKIGFNYIDMEHAGVEFPVVDVHVKYIRSLHFGETVRAVAGLTEYENCIKIAYEFYNNDTGELTTMAESTQMAVHMQTGETLFVCPDVFIDRVHALQQNQ
ncbi:MAG: acyl-CoA thioesterase [Treponema sp.]|nr:acyl-CoA thioesterase [Treponema sp.]